MSAFKIILSIILWFFPWGLRYRLLNKMFGYQISGKAKIGFSIILPTKLEMSDYSRIGHLTVCKGLNLLRLGERSAIGNLNWITGFPITDKTFFQHRLDRQPSLEIGRHSAITHRHYLDCTDRITVGDFTTVAGFYSQLLTHSIDILESRQNCQPINIGSYCFIGTACVFLPGSSMGDYCVLGAQSLLNKKCSERYLLYGGVPAIPVKELPNDAKYFTREVGFIH